MCTWAPTPRVAVSFRAAFAHVLMPRNRLFLIGSNEPIPLEPEVWAARAARPEIARYLGEAAAEDLRRSVPRLVPLPEPLPEEIQPDEDLYPRDEFLTP
jgi:hypothetical protein